MEKFCESGIHLKWFFLLVWSWHKQSFLKPYDNAPQPCPTVVIVLGARTCQHHQDLLDLSVVLLSHMPLRNNVAHGSLALNLNIYVGPQIGMNPKPLLGLPDLEYWLIPTQTNSGSPCSNMGIAFLVFFSVTHKIGLFSPKIEAIPTPEKDDAGRCRCRPWGWCLLGDLCFLCSFWLVTHQSNTSYLRFRGVTKWPTQACTIYVCSYLGRNSQI